MLRTQNPVIKIEHWDMPTSLSTISTTTEVNATIYPSNNIKKTYYLTVL